MNHSRPKGFSYGFKGFDGKQTPKVTVLHTIEGDGAGDKWMRAVMDNVKSRKLCVHAVVDKHGRIGYMMDAQVKGRGARPNTGKIHIEQAGRASFTREQWMARPAQLHATARLIAWYSYRWGIPIKHSTELGVCQHRDLPGNNHTDCGEGYPEAYVLSLARSVRAHEFKGRFV